ncbi:MAG: Bax inhibitor-1/YccA family protein [Actinomycetota bacterium]
MHDSKQRSVESETEMARSNPVLSKTFPEQTGFGTLPPAYGTLERLSIDDVVVHTAGLLALLVAVAAVSWITVPISTGLGFVIPAVLLAVGIVIYSGIKRRVSPAMAIGYAVVEGFVVGVISHVYNDFTGVKGTVNPANSGIVLQAVVATIAVFFGMLALYQTGVIRATPKFRKVVMTATLGIFLTYMASIVMNLFGAHMPLLNSSSSLGILVSAAIVVIAALNFILDFDQIERAVAAGAPREYAWAASLGLLVTLVWLYLEMLRLLSKLQSR